jgi:hypothetical protein
MTNNLIAKVSVIINAPVSKVWEALTDPGQMNQHLSGEPHIVGIVPERILHTAYFSYLSGQEDKPENYSNVVYEVSPENGRTLMTITQDHIENQGDLLLRKQAWGTVLAGMKNRIE